MNESRDSDSRRVCIIVLGDMGHSPRMQYHAISLASHHFMVDFIGYKGSRPHEAVINNERITLHVMDDVPKFNDYLPRILTYLFKTLWQSLVLFKLLLSITKPNYILVQNPPSIPTLWITWFYSWLRRCHLIVDWHNYGFTILALTLGDNHILVKVCKFVEGYFGSRANSHICVTEALKNDLYNRWKIKANVLYDRPPAIFRPISIRENHNLFLKLKTEYTEFNAENGANKNETIFTACNESEDRIYLKQNRPALLISSTSWTEDEDFNILLEALKIYESMALDENNHLPKLLCVITGKGPLKSFYQQKIAELDLKCVRFILPWLSAEDYPKLLACANVGVSLHKSSSNLDLPMKVVDMFGCCLPVCALEYPCIDELVKHQENGLLFKTSDELASHLKLLLEHFPHKNYILDSFRSNLRNYFTQLRWDQCWRENAFPIFDTK